MELYSKSDERSANSGALRYREPSEPSKTSSLMYSHSKRVFLHRRDRGTYDDRKEELPIQIESRETEHTHEIEFMSSDAHRTQSGSSRQRSDQEGEPEVSRLQMRSYKSGRLQKDYPSNQVED